MGLSATLAQLCSTSANIGCYEAAIIGFASVLLRKMKQPQVGPLVKKHYDFSLDSSDEIWAEI